MPKANISKKLILITLSLVFIFGIIPLEEVKAGASDNLSGWAWSENIGWISFNCTNQNTCLSVNYGVRISATGLVSGYAWSENIGWITFNSSGPNELANCPVPGTCEARYDSTSKELSGWARACSVFQTGCSGTLDANRGNWEGWIHLKGGGYGVVLNASNEFASYAWGGDVMGWISFNCLNNSICGTVPYKVIFSGSKPSASILTCVPDNSADYCSNPVNPPVRLTWTFNGANAGDTQSAYQIQIALDAGFSNIIEDKGKISNSGGAYIASNLNYGVTYYWRLRVWDNNNNVSDWVTGPSCTTIAYPYPTPNFSWTPAKIIIGDPVDFSNSTDFHGDPGVKSYKWDVDNNGTTDYTSKDILGHVYAAARPGGYTVKLEATVGGKTCSIIKNSVPVLFAPPIWKETPPQF